MPHPNFGLWKPDSHLPSTSVYNFSYQSKSCTSQAGDNQTVDEEDGVYNYHGDENIGKENIIQNRIILCDKKFCVAALVSNLMIHINRKMKIEERRKRVNQNRIIHVCDKKILCGSLCK